MKHILFSNAGQSLVSVLISLAITGIVMVATMQIIDNQNKSLRFFTQKNDVLETRSMISQMFRIEEVCKWQLAGAGVLDTTALTEKKFSMSAIYSGIDATSSPIIKVGQNISAGLKVESISFGKISPVGTQGAFRGEFEISFANAESDFSIAPVKIPQIFFTKVSDPANAQRIISCSKSTSAVSCPSNLWLMSTNPTDPGKHYFETITLAQYNKQDTGQTTATKKVLVLPDLYEGEIYSTARAALQNVYVEGKRFTTSISPFQACGTQYQCIDGKVIEISTNACEKMFPSEGA